MGGEGRQLPLQRRPRARVGGARGRWGRRDRRGRRRRRWSGCGDVFSLRSRTNHYVNRTTLFPPSITHCSSIRDFLLDCRRSMTPPLLVGMNPCRGCSIRERSQQPSRIFSDEEATPNKISKLQWPGSESGRCPPGGGGGGRRPSRSPPARQRPGPEAQAVTHWTHRPDHWQVTGTVTAGAAPPGPGPGGGLGGAAALAALAALAGSVTVPDSESPE